MKKWLPSEFERNVFKLFSGTAIAQLIPWAISPILTRLYTPEQFGALTILLSILVIGNTINTAKYEIAIYLPGNSEKAWIVVGLNVIVSVILFALLTIMFFVFGQPLKRLIGAEDLGVWFYLSPLIILFMGLYKISYSWLNRLKRYTRIATARVVRSLALSGTQLALGIAGLKSTGLLIGQGLGEICAAIFMLMTGRKYFSTRNISRPELKDVAREYSGFPKYSLPGDFINSVSNQAPVFLFSSFFNQGIVGQYGLTFRILSAPVSLFASAILDVFKQKASEDYAQTGSCRNVFLSTLKKLTIISLPVFLAIGLFGPQLFGFVFGNEWVEAGKYASILSILFFTRFIASPLSYVLYIAQKQKVDLMWQIVLCLVIVASLFIGISLNSVYLTLWLFAISYSLMYIVYLYLSYIYSVNRSAV